MTDEALAEFAPFGLVIRGLCLRDDAPYGGAGIRMKINADGGNAEWFAVWPEFVDGYQSEFPRRVINRGRYLLIQRDGEDFIATPLDERDAWQVDPYYLEA